jgi:subtilisin family serine protease
MLLAILATAALAREPGPGNARAAASASAMARALQPGKIYWLQASEKRDAAGALLVPGSRAWEDAPVSPRLLDALRARGWTVRTTLRWANLVSAVAPSANPALPEGLVLHAPVASAAHAPVPPTPPVAGRAVSVDPSAVTLRRMHDTLGVTFVQDSLRALGQLPGQGVKVAVIDDGFVLQHEVLRAATVVDAWDWVSGDAISWDEGPAPWTWNHGTATAGLIASSWTATLPGIAPWAQLLLYRTEDDDRETRTEEDWLAAAIERAVENGAGVISISLGYRYLYDDGNPDHPYESFDGRTLVASRTAAWAAGRDVVVVVAMGNDGAIGGPTLGSPADADSVLAVGAVSEGLRLCDFSSQGPSSDGRIKPELVAFGCPVPVASGNGAQAYSDAGQGTSYATPLLAGAVVLLRQLRPSWSAMEVRQALLRSGDRADRPDNSYGWGMPDLRRALGVFVEPPRGSVKLPGIWRASREAFRFVGTPPVGEIEFRFQRLDGRLVHQARVTGATLWRGSPTPGTYIATWRTKNDQGSRLVVVSDR